METSRDLGVGWVEVVGSAHGKGRWSLVEDGNVHISWSESEVFQGILMRKGIDIN
jgi:hypothetical protein